MKSLIFSLCFCVLLQEIYVYADGGCQSLRLQNGKVRFRQRRRFVKFVCNLGYTLVGERYTSCLNGQLETDPPKCVRNTCYKVNPPMNGLIYSSYNGAVLHFYCKAGFQLHGSNVTHCDGRRWDSSLPSCLPTNTLPSLSCDFESVDLCGWSQDLNHEFDWIRENYDTPSGTIGTGPNFDHTKGEGQDGYYMYIESSSRNENDTARLISPVYGKTTSNTCFEFYYHMYGLTIGTLRVYLKTFSESWELKPEKAFFSKSHNQGDQWYRSINSLGAINESFQIIIEGVRGSGYVSDIAIDDVRIIEQCVIDEEESTTIFDGLPISQANIFIFESCQSRCGNKSHAINSKRFQLMCDCDDNCLVHHKCCPDYIDACILGNTVTDISISTTNEDSTNEPSTETETNYMSTTLLDQQISTILSTKRKLPSSLSTKLIEGKQTTARQKPPRKPLVILTRPTTTRIYQKVPPPKFNLPPWKENEVIKENENDVGLVPKMTNVDETSYVTSPMLKTEEPVLLDKNDYSEEIENEIAGPFLTKYSESHHLVLANSGYSNYTTIVIATSSLILVLTTVVLTVIVVKCKIFKCTSLKRRSSNGDSQSDVRYLTSDEILDLTLSDDYNTL